MLIWNRNKNDSAAEIAQLRAALEDKTRQLAVAEQRIAEAEQRAHACEAKARFLQDVVANLATFSQSLKETQSSLAALANTGTGQHHAGRAGAGAGSADTIAA